MAFNHRKESGHGTVAAEKMVKLVFQLISNTIQSQFTFDHLSMHRT